MRGFRSGYTQWRLKNKLESSIYLHYTTKYSVTVLCNNSLQAYRPLSILMSTGLFISHN